ncbi:MAG: hypothetical protein H3C50_06705 [Kiritimatiellae bacterium]|nr:hypothetical protein [Kiritimatiellia bacterium]MCO5067421.1 FAD-binding oxidoreductase [Kiritimatiellia bacterium]
MSLKEAEQAAQKVRRWKARVLRHRPLSPTAFELTLSREGLDFRAGQLLTVHGRTLYEDRNYSIASGEKDDHIQILYRLIPSGALTPQLAALTEGDALEISAPSGEFMIRDRARPLVFIATGTGIAPCRSYIRTHPDLAITILHGVRTAEDLFYREELSSRVYHPCLSADDSAGFRGRVTDLSKTFPFPDNAHFYLCGANEMFYDMRDILRERNINPAAIFTEAYYYTHEV